MSDPSQAPLDGDISSKTPADPLAQYTRSLHDYTLALWTESRRVAEEKGRAQPVINRPTPSPKPAAEETGKEGQDPAQQTASGAVVDLSDNRT